MTRDAKIAIDFHTSKSRNNVKYNKKTTQYQKISCGQVIKKTKHKPIIVVNTKERYSKDYGSCTCVAKS